MKKHLLVYFFLCATLMLSSCVEHEENVDDLIKNYNATKIRRNIEKLYGQAKEYERAGETVKAIGILEKALEADSTNLPYQVMLAKLLDKVDRKQEAVERLLLIYPFIENEALFEETKKILCTENVPFPALTPLADVDDSIEIVLVPMGDINHQALSELQGLLQKRMGIKITKSDQVVELGDADRRQAPFYLRKYLVHLKIPGQPFQFGLRRSEIEGQYLTSNLIERLRKAIPFGQDNKIKGYLGVTSKGLYCPTCNFLFGDSEYAYGVISYNQFTASANGQRENRQLLVQRLLKQSLSSANFLLGIPRCNTPYCARAYPHSLAELDSKSDELCPVCSARLEAYKKSAVYPFSAAELYRIGSILINNGDNEQAVTYYARALKEDPGCADAHYGLGTAYSNQKLFDDALTAFRKAHALAPDITDFRVSIGKMLIAKGEFEAAAVELSKALEKEPMNAKALGQMGYCQLQLKRFKEAVPYFEKALATDSNPVWYLNLGASFKQSGAPDKAIEAYKTMIEIHPDDYRGYYYLGDALKAHNIPESNENLKRAIALNPTFADAYDMLGANLGQSGMIDEAIETFKKGLAVAPDHDMLLNDLGYTYYLKKEYFQALEEYEKALAVNPNHALCHYNKAQAHFALNQYKGAKFHYDKASELGYGGSPEFKSAIDRALKI